MIVTRIRTTGWRNLAPGEWSTDAAFVVLEGRNGQGKTHALEAVFAPATLKPIHGRRLKEAVPFDGERGAVQVDVVGRDGPTRLELEVSAHERRMVRDGVTVREPAGWFGPLRVVAFTPEDLVIGAGEPAARRAWMDRAAFTRFPGHLDRVLRVRRLLDQKGAALRDGADDAVLDVLDDGLAEAGAALVDARARHLTDLEPVVARVHGLLAGSGVLGLSLRTVADGVERSDREARLRERLVAARSEERRRRTTLVGPQHDELVLTLDGRIVRSWASRGQTRAVVLALKLGELEVAKRAGTVPAFLLDDVGSELDAERTARLVDLLGDLGCQVFATTTEASWLRNLPAASTLHLRVDAGRVGHGGDTVLPAPRTA